MGFTIGSLFDGSGGFPLAAFLSGGVPVWASEIEPYPIAVTKSRFPYVKHLGSVTDINGGKIDPVDVITFGSPCQDLSVAGKRAGLKHEANGDEETTRSGLFMEAVRIIKEMREKTNGVYPRIAVWENVPGAFSSNKGEDFRIVCEELIKIIEPSASMPPVPKNGWAYADCYVGDGWSLAYRVLDAQHWGVPQRRRRIYLVADFRGQRAGKVLFERDGVRGYFETGRTPWQTTPVDAERGVGADDREGERISVGFPLGFRPENVRLYDEVATTLCNGTRPGFTCGVIESQSLVGFDAYQHHGWRQSEVCGTLTAGQNDSIRGDTPLVAVAQPLCMATQQGGAEIMEDKCPTITAAAGMSGNNQPVVCYDARGNGDGVISNTLIGDHQNRITDYTSVVVEPIPIHDQATRFSGKHGDKFDGKGNDLGVGNPGDPMNTLTGGDRHAVAYWDGGQTAGTLTANNAGGSQRMPDKDNFNCVIEQSPCRYTWGDRQGGFADYVEGEVGTLRAAGGDYGGGTENLLVEHPSIRYIVRRLTPTECARLQGFPDKWGHPDHKDDLTEEEYRFWLNVRNTHAAINGKATRDYTKQQMLTWYNKLHTDSSEYKMWGNGIALPNALYVMQGIAEVFDNESH